MRKLFGCSTKRKEIISGECCRSFPLNNYQWQAENREKPIDLIQVQENKIARSPRSLLENANNIFPDNVYFLLLPIMKIK